MVGLAFAMPAIAAPSNSSNTFPSNGQMQEDTKYVGAATQTNLHSYEGPVRATANYTDTPYTVTAGNYLPMSSETVAQCTSGNYCPGINGTVNYSTSANQGLTACPNGYPNSLAGATSDTECYTACTVANAGIDHASAVSGNDYYGTGVDTCVPTSCVAGWHLNPGAPDLATIIGNKSGENSAAINSSGSFRDYNGQYSNNIAEGKNYFGITEPMSFAVDYGDKGIIRGKGRCSTQTGDNQSGEYTNPTMFNSLTDETGRSGAQYCYCQLDGYTSGGTMQPISTPWMFASNLYEGADCEMNCPGQCALYLKDSYYSRFRTALFNSVTGGGTPTCDANVISITWDGADQTDIDANNAGQCTYGGDINTPKKAVHVPGKTFVGWTFDTPSGN